MTTEPRSAKVRENIAGLSLDRKRLRGLLHGFTLAVVVTMVGLVPALTLNLGETEFACGSKDEASQSAFNVSDFTAAGTPETPAAPQATRATAPRATAAQATVAESSEGMSPADPKVQVALRHLERGLEFQRTGSLNQAVSEYRSALSYDDNLVGAHLKLGEALCELKQFGPAAGALTRALALDPDNVETLSAMAMLNYARGSDKLAAERWRQVIERDPKNAAAHYNLGLSLERQRDFEGARESYSKALALEPTMTRVIERLSSISQRVVDQKRDTQVFARAGAATAGSFEPRAAQEIHQAVPEREEPAARSTLSGSSPFGVAARAGEPAVGSDADDKAAPVSAPLANAGGQKGGDVMFEPANVGGAE